jgi:LppX_LprAFG lipoprotein
LTGVRRAIIVGAAGLVVGLTGACGGHASVPKVDAPTLLRQAKTTIDATSSVHFVLTSQGVSSGGTDLTGGAGDLARPDQLQGSFKVDVNGFSVSVKVVSKNGVFEALLPFQSHYALTKPANFGLTDPSQLLDPTHGLSNLLIIGSGAAMTGQERIAGELLYEVTATVPGSAIPVLPDANPSRPVTLVAAINPKNHQVRQITLTGPFTSASSNSTFVVTLTKYGEAVTITLPPT